MTIFQIDDSVRDLLTKSVIEFKTAMATAYNGKVVIVENIYNPRNKENTDYKILVRCCNNLMVFGDNASGIGRGGSAAVRAEPNAFGIPTGWNDHYGPPW